WSSAWLTFVALELKPRKVLQDTYWKKRALDQMIYCWMTSPISRKTKADCPILFLPLRYVMNWLLFFNVLGVLIIVVLATIAARLQYKVYRQKKEREEKLKALEEANQKAQREHRKWLNKSIQILAQAVDNDELTLTEASIRIAGLMDSLDVPMVVKEEFSAFYQLREKTAHIPYLDAWKNLSNAEQKKFDLERLHHEHSFNDFVRDAAKRILGRDF